VIFRTKDYLKVHAKDKYNNIRANLDNYDLKSIDIIGESTEGGQGLAYYSDNNIKLIEITWYGETGKRKIEYYFDNKQLFFAFDSRYQYNRPIYWNEKLAKENNDKEVFDSKKTTVKEDRYYFLNDKLIRWINSDKKNVDVNTGLSYNKEEELTSYAYKLMNELKKSTRGNSNLNNH
jgi:hypothetical protein